MFGRLVLVALMVLAAPGVAIGAAAEDAGAEAGEGQESPAPGIQLPLLDGSVFLGLSEGGRTMYRADVSVLAPIRAHDWTGTTELNLFIEAGLDGSDLMATSSASLLAMNGGGTCVSMTTDPYMRVSPTECVKTG